MRRNLVKLIAMPLGIGISVILGFITFQYFQDNMTRASNPGPRDMQITNITNNSVTLKWKTDQESQAVIEYGTSASQLSFYYPETVATSSHELTISLLSPKTNYFFGVRIGDKLFLDEANGNLPWTFITKGNDEVGQTNDKSKVIVKPLKIGKPTDSVSKITILPPHNPEVCTPSNNCEEMLNKPGCSTQDYMKCLRKKKEASF